MQLKQGTLLQNGKYRIEEVLGQGGFGITYLAMQVALSRKVAIKEFFMKEYCNREADASHVSVPSIGSKELVGQFRDKFVKEAQNIANLKHNNIIRIHDVFEENNTAYYVMEYLDCGSLSDYVTDKGRLSEEEAVSYIRQIADALAYIHEQKINHLDVKPSNILLDKKNNAVLIDFGLSKHYDNTGDQTSSTPVGISKGYAPMEQYKQGGVSKFSPETDIYSLGAIFYKLLTGDTPPEADEINENGLEFPYNLHLSDNIKNAIIFAMQPKRKDRPHSVEEFLECLDEEKVTNQTDNEETKIIGEEKPVSISVPVSEPEKKKNYTWIFVLLLIIIGGGGYYFINERIQEEEKYVKNHGTINGHEYIDLGLPSGLKWATCNVGANKPEDYGNYYAWGETKTKSSYTQSNSVTYGNKNFSDIGGDSQYDAAQANWGGTWRLPTRAELEELEDKCTWTWTMQNGVKGYKVTGPNGNSIFLPAAGYRYGTSLCSGGYYGYYWSSTPYDGYDGRAYILDFSNGCEDVGISLRNDGLTVRPVSE